jgi:hypothetical protein
MSQSLEEMQDYLRANAMEARSAQAEQQKSREYVGKVMGELLAEPRWELYARHVKALRDTWFDKNQRSVSELTNSLLEPNAYIQCKVSQAQAAASVLAYDTVLQLITDLVKQTKIDE